MMMCMYVYVYTLPYPPVTWNIGSNGAIPFGIQKPGTSCSPVFKKRLDAALRMICWAKAMWPVNPSGFTAVVRALSAAQAAERTPLSVSKNLLYYIAKDVVW